MAEQRVKSLWGWGFEDAAIPLDEVRVRVEPLLGPLEEQLPAPPRIPASRLEDLPGADRSDLGRAAHAMGKSYLDRLRGFRGDFGSAPDAVVTPASEAELEQVLERAEAGGWAVVPFGGGTSVVGGVEPPRGERITVSLDTRGLSGLLEVDDVSLCARLQAGILGPDIEAKLARAGLTLRHYPQSFEHSTLGGWIATRAGGHFATGPTHVDELVQAVRMVTPRGVWQTARVPASGAGPDPARLVCGSEGILGIITEAWMRVRRRPSSRASAAVHFADFSTAVDATRAIAQSGLLPSNCRLLDPTEALLSGASGDGEAILLLGFEAHGRSARGPAEEALTIATRLGGTAPRGLKVRDGEDARGPTDASDTWRDMFLRGPYLQDAMIRLGVLADTLETACTWDRFERLYRDVKAALEEATCGGLVACRFTHVYPDGPAPYFTFLVKARTGEEAQQWWAIKEAASRALVDAGGTITHHHAVGRLHRRWYDRERPDPFAAALTAAKRAVDPTGLLNPGVLIG